MSRMPIAVCFLNNVLEKHPEYYIGNVVRELYRYMVLIKGDDIYVGYFLVIGQLVNQSSLFRTNEKRDYRISQDY